MGRARTLTGRRAWSRFFAHHLHTGQAPTLFGHGKPTRDYVYVGDVVGALRAASGRSGTYNVATGVETDVITLWNELRTLAGSDLEPQLADLRPGELQHSCLDTSLAQRELGWRAEVPIEQGLRLTYEALLEEFERVVGGPRRPRVGGPIAGRAIRRAGLMVGSPQGERGCMRYALRVALSVLTVLSLALYIAPASARGEGSGGAQAPAAPLAGGVQYGVTVPKAAIKGPGRAP